MYVFIETDNAWRQILAERLDEVQEQYHFAFSWQDLLAHPPPFVPKVLVFELGPFQTGIEDLVSEVRASSSFSVTPLIAFTYNDDLEYVKDVLSCGFSSYFSKKETTPQQLLEAISQQT